MPDPKRLWRVATAAAVAGITIAAAASGSVGSSLAVAAHHHGPAIGHHHSPAVGGPSGDNSRALARYMGPTRPPSSPTPGIACDKGSRPEKVQGKVPKADYDSGRAAKGYFCNARQISHFLSSGGYRVERYVDKAGHECAYWDSTLLWPHNAPEQGTGGPGVYVMDMSDPAKPVHTDTLRTPAMQSPHESVRLNTKRGLLAAVMGYPTWHPGFVDVFDVTEDCRHPVLESSTPMGILGHESGFSPDGKTFYVAGLYAHTLTAVDLTNPKAPVLLWATADYQPHGVSISNDGNRLYMAENAFDESRGDFSGLTILDVSEVQKRVPNPSVPIISRLTWPELSTPQNATPFTINGHEYLLETDEFGSGKNVGAARIIDIHEEKKPFVVSNLRLAVNKGDQTEDPGDDQPFQGYQGHYCSLPSRVDPYIVACSFIMSGLRVFDISNPAHPREVAYFNKPLIPGTTSFYPTKAGAFAMSAPAYDEETGDIWYTDGHTGFFVVRLTDATRVTKFAERIVTPGN
ncbi:MAG: LVIVD repeat-containing protein [Actinomycetota bacterium]